MNPYAAKGVAAGGFYVTKDEMAFVVEPAVTKLSNVASHVPARHFGQGDALFPVMNTREPSGMPMVAVPVGASNVPYAVV